MRRPLPVLLVLVLLGTLAGLAAAEQRRPVLPSALGRDLVARLTRAIGDLAGGGHGLRWLQGLGRSAPPAAKRHPRGTRAMVLACGYPLEPHEVRTDDGYLLRVFRLPRPGRPVALLMHGLIMSSADYVTRGRQALPFLLHDAGLDVWMCNARGNMESLRHEAKHPDDADFWDFSWHEIGVHDVPSCIDYVLAATNQSALHYVGHSQGTTTFFVMGSERPEYMAKIKSFVGMAPVAFVRDTRSDLLRVSIMLGGPAFFRRVGAPQLLPNPPFLSSLKQALCSPGMSTQPFCFAFLFLIAGFDSTQVNSTMLPAVFTNWPGGSSMKQLEHFGQLSRSRELEFHQFDYKTRGNLVRYGQARPPHYDLGRVTAPTYLIHSDNDVLAVQSNVDELRRRLPNVLGVSRVPDELFNHLDFMYGRDAKEFVYDYVLDCIRRHEVLLPSP